MLVELNVFNELDKHVPVYTLSPAVFFDIPAYFTSNLRVKEWEPESLREIVENLLLIINL